MLISLIVWGAAAAQQPAWNCQQPVAQQEMNFCATKDFQRAEAQMNLQFEATSRQLRQRDAEWNQPLDERPGHFNSLLMSQRGWKQYRDAHCQAEGYRFRGGSMEPYVNTACKARLTRERIVQLRDLT